VGAVAKQKGPSIDYPEDPNSPKRFIMQNHHRGRSVHGDIRFSLGPHAEGWTIMHAMPDAIKVPVVTLRQARELWKDQSVWKIDLKTGKIFPRKVQTTIQGRKRIVVRPGNLFAERKAAVVPNEWLDVEGVTPFPPDWPKSVLEWWDRWPVYVRAELRRKGWTPERARAILEGEEEWEAPPKIPVGATRSFPGVFHKVEDGSYILGARKPWFFEYFVERGRFFNGRLVFRFVRKAQKASWDALKAGDLAPDGSIVLPPGEGEGTLREPGYWLFMTLDDEDVIKPYVLSDEAIEDGWLPPPGVAALPQDFIGATPRSLRYWTMDREDALEARRELAAYFEELGWSRSKARSAAKALRSKAEARFRLVLQTFKKQFVIRWGPTTSIWWLLLRLPNKRLLVALDNSPLVRDAVAGARQDPQGRWDRLWALRGSEEVEPGTALNPTKDTPSRITLLDEGPVDVLDERPGFFKLDFSGSDLRGPWILYEEEPGAGIFGFQRTELGPKVSKQARYVLHQHEVEGRVHWDIRMDLGTGPILEFSLSESPLEAKDPIPATWLKQCLDRTWMEISEPETPRKVQGVWTKVTPLGEGSVLRFRRGEDHLDLELDGVLRGGFRLQRLDGSALLLRLEPVEKAFQVVHKADEKRIVYGVVLSPHGPDAQGDVIPPEEIEEAAHNFIAFGGAIGINHEGRPIAARPVESFIAPVDFEYVPGKPESRIRKGEWVLAVKVFDDAVWEKVKRGELTGFSIQGWARRQKLR